MKTLLYSLARNVLATACAVTAGLVVTAGFASIGMPIGLAAVIGTVAYVFTLLSFAV